MKTVCAISLALVAFTQTAVAEDAPQPWQAKALKTVKQEKKVIDARWRSAESNMLWVAVQPDGSNRDGFAQYLCMIFNKAGAPEGELKTVWIYDPASFEDGGKQIGMAACR